MVDLYHDRQHRWEVVRKLYPQDARKLKAWMKVHPKGLLDKGKIEKLVEALGSIPSSNPEGTEKLRTVLAAARMGPLWQGQMGPGRQTWMAASKGPWWAVDFRVRF